MKTYNKDDNSLFSDSYWFLCKNVSDVKGELIHEYKHGKNFWGSLDDVIKFENESAVKSEFMLDYFKELKKNPNFQLPYTYVEEFLKVSIE